MDGRETTGIVFDIQRGSLNDGPGIRTTIFLKGCPMRCVWCHNPEAVEFQPQLFFNAEKCIACGNCERACESGVHHIRDGVHLIEYQKCAASGRCIQVCNRRALKIVGCRLSVREVMLEVLADRAFYQHSGGGLTLSGGEPMAQFYFTLKLLQSAKKEGVHTCLETSGYAATERYEEILPYVDLFLFDYKIGDSAAHQRYTGVPNERILFNLDYLYHQHKPLILRCPIISNINDTQNHFQSIADLNFKYPGLAGIELLPYHDMGNSKRVSIGASRTLVGLKTTPRETAAEWLVQIHGLGCEKARIG